MDDGLDELFGDAPPLHISEGLPKGLAQRVDELSLSGCCQKLTWSKNGCIAYISQDGRNVILRHLLCDSYDGQWRMSREHTIDDIQNAHNEHPISHLCWGHTGNELAIVDVFGRISIYNVFLAINRLTAIRRCSTDPEDNLGAVVGTMWLYSDRWNFFHHPMRKTTTEGWVFKCSQRRLLGPHNIAQRPALVTVTRSGMIRVLSQGQDNRWQDFKTEIENTASALELLTHVAICPEKIADKLTPEQESAVLVATYNNNKDLKVHRLRIDFERSRIELQHVKVLDRFAPLQGNSIEITGDQEALLSRTQLSLLEFIPPGPISGTRDLTPPSIIASFSYLSDSVESTSTQTSHLTVLCKLELQLESPKWHGSFDSLSSKKTSISSIVDLSSQAEYVLKRSVDLFVPRSLLGIHQVNMSTILVMIYSDGIIEYRDRTSMKTLAQNAKDEFSTLGQIGFDTPMKKNCLYSTISPNLCATVSLDELHVASLNLMQMGNEDFFDGSILEVVNEAFVMQGSLAAMNFLNYNDDLLAITQAFVRQHLLNGPTLGHPPAVADSETFKWQFLSEMYRVLGLQYDYSVDSHPQQIIQNNVIQRCLSTQASLGNSGTSIRPSLPAMIAHTTLDLRHVAYSLMYATRSKPGSDGELKNPDSVHFLIGLVSWLLALFGFIVDEIFTLADFLEEQGAETGNTVELLNFKVRDMNSPALPLLLISSSRTLLRLNCLNMRSLYAAAKAHSGTGPLGLAHRELEAVFQKTPITVFQFEHLLTQIDASVKSTYQNAGIHYDDIDNHKREKEERNNIEKEMLTKASIPDIHLETVKELLTTTVNALKEQVNVAELYFLDIGFLGLTDDQSSRKWREKHPMDAMRKTELKKDTRTKRCTRCGALTEDMLPFRGVNMMVMNLQRYCICGSWFMIGEEENAAQVGNGGY